MGLLFMRVVFLNTTVRLLFGGIALLPGNGAQKQIRPAGNYSFSWNGIPGRRGFFVRRSTFTSMWNAEKVVTSQVKSPRSVTSNAPKSGGPCTRERYFQGIGRRFLVVI